ncbi:GntR family transcriptional regulator [Microbacterium capsulatum]|uniref:GntR family transcriptional regulator n=1 Tax=Microbacterium capsulatum TaxID=3041921 RepID=A0ABU0XCR9_9MICO|nr:GntR family transcriptional regulator [Microbacterium sp. ASV81]MDQ4212909.1 GntR family transcriptional regulator [Microbacterium sp. ASV81]
MPRKRAMLNVERVTSPSLPDLIADRLRQAIIEGQIREGEQLVEPDLVERFGASRPTVREALQRLVQEGLLTAIPHRGVFVTTISPEDIVDIYNARRTVESSAAVSLVKDPAPEVMAQLRVEYAAMVEAFRVGAKSDITAADQRFHEALVSGLRNRRLLKASRTFLVETRLCLARLEGRYPFSQTAVDEHLDIIRAIERRDIMGVMKAVDDHMDNAIALQQKTWDPAEDAARASV